MAQLSPILKQATPVLAVRGEGVHLYDEAGHRHLDFTAGIGVTSTGHCHPRVVRAAQEQVATLIHGQYTTVMHRPLLRLTERLGEVLPEGLDSLFYLNSGSEAVEAAIRLARHATGRQNIVVFHGSFHGRTMGAASLTTAGTKFRAGIGPLMPGAAVAPFPQAYRYGWSEEEATRFALRELDYLLATVSPAQDTAAFIVEPVLGEGGYVPAPPGFLEGLRERADRHGCLLIVDEVQTGFGRTGTVLGPPALRRPARRPHHRQGPGQRLPPVGDRRSGRDHEPRVARLAGRHVRRQRGGVRGRAGDARRDPGRGPGGQLRADGRPAARRPAQGRLGPPGHRRRTRAGPHGRQRVRHRRRAGHRPPRSGLSRRPANAACCC